MSGTPTCHACRMDNCTEVPTYKRNWFFCRSCGSAFHQERNKYPLGFLPINDLKQQEAISEENIYDYFITEPNIKASLEEQVYFHEKYIVPMKIDFSNKVLLDISGGNGHFARKYYELGAKVHFTEINRKALDYVSREHPFEGVYEYDMNRNKLESLTNQNFDVVFARACIMFCHDLDDFAGQIMKVVKEGGLVIIDCSVEPTMGTVLRVQLDEYTYHMLRQPDMIISTFKEHGFHLLCLSRESDPTLYVYDHDLLLHWKLLHYFYELKSIKALSGSRIFSFPARDRRRSTLIFQRT